MLTYAGLKAVWHALTKPHVSQRDATNTSLRVCRADPCRRHRADRHEALSIQETSAISGVRRREGNTHTKLPSALSAHSLTADKFLYFFMGLRKGEIRRRIAALKASYPDEGPEQLARRPINAQSTLPLAGGALLHVPVFMLGVGPALKLIGVAGAAAVLMRVHMALKLEIGLLFGHDIDRPERLREIAAIIVASGLVAGTPFLTRALNLKL